MTAAAQFQLSAETKSAYHTITEARGKLERWPQTSFKSSVGHWGVTQKYRRSHAEEPAAYTEEFNSVLTSWLITYEAGGDPLTAVSFSGGKLMSPGCSSWLRQVGLGTQLGLVISGGSGQEKRQRGTGWVLTNTLFLRNTPTRMCSSQSTVASRSLFLYLEH